MIWLELLKLICWMGIVWGLNQLIQQDNVYESPRYQYYDSLFQERNQTLFEELPESVVISIDYPLADTTRFDRSAIERPLIVPDTLK